MIQVIQTFEVNIHKIEVILEKFAACEDVQTLLASLCTYTYGLNVCTAEKH